MTVFAGTASKVRGWVLQLTRLSSHEPASGTASSVRPAVVDSPYRRSVAFSSVQFGGGSVGTSNLTSVRAFSPMTGSGGLAVGSPTDDARTVSSVIIWKFSSGTTWSTQPSAV